jgi:hypothetical protein
VRRSPLMRPEDRSFALIRTRSPGAISIPTARETVNPGFSRGSLRSPFGDQTQTRPWSIRLTGAAWQEADPSSDLLNETIIPGS